LLGILATVRKGQLFEFSTKRDGAGDWVECRFLLDIHPGVEFTYRHGVYNVNHEPLMSAESAVGVFMAALVERTSRVLPTNGGEISL